MGVVFSIKCTHAAHYWTESDKVHKGILFQCKYCQNYIWLPTDWEEVERLSRLIDKYGKDEGYYHYLNHDSHRYTKILIAKMQMLARLSSSITDSLQFAKLVDKILSEKEYDKEIV